MVVFSPCIADDGWVARFVWLCAFMPNTFYSGGMTWNIQVGLSKSVLSICIRFSPTIYYITIIA